jgi:spermidine synthase
MSEQEMTEEKISPHLFQRAAHLVLICFFFSGITGLIYEILWTRMMVELIGSSPFTVSIILTVFMGGLGLGSFLAGRTIDRVKEPMELVKIYGILELVIGAYGFAVPILLVAFRPFYAIFYNQLFNYFMLYNLLTFLGCCILLCIPVICMGATLPILCRFYVTKLSLLGTHAGRLYGLNTVGAAFGALLCGFWLINLLGVWGTLILAVFINGAVGLSCLWLSHNVDKQQLGKERATAEPLQYPQADTAEARFSEYPGMLVGALIIFAVSGFCAMSYEVVWTKLLGLIVGPTTYSFTIVLVTFILGLALGSMFFGWLGDKVNKVMWLLIFTQVAAALFALGVSQLVGNSQLFFAKLIFSFIHRFALLNAAKAVVLFGFMILPTVCLGATFPLVGKIYTQSYKKIGRSIGFAYSINTIGAVAGSFCTDFLLTPLCGGKEKALSVVIGLQILTSLVIATFIFVRNKENLLKWVSLAAVALTGLFFCLHLPMWNRLLLSKGKYYRFDELKINLKGYGWLETLLHGSKILSGSSKGELVYYGDGVGGFTTVLKYADPLGAVYYSMTISGKPDASSRGDMKTETLSAHLPMLFHKNPETVMVLGLASGITAGEVLYYPVERLDVIDINKQVVAGSRFFLPWNNNVLSNPRTNLIIQDGRAHLRLTKQKYDVIISEPSNPWMAGLAALFTREFFSLAEERLNEDGIFVQFFHSYEMDWSTFALVGRTFAEVFPNSLLASAEPFGLGSDYLLVGFKGKNSLILANAERNIRYAQKSKNINLSDPRLLYRLIVSEDLQKLFEHGPVNTDNWPRLEFAAPRLMYTSSPTMVAENIWSRRWLSSATAAIAREITTDVNAQIDFAAYAFSVYAPFGDMVDLSKATPAQRKRFFEMWEAYCAKNGIEPSFFNNDELLRRCYSIQIKTLEDNIDRMPDKAISYFYLGDIYLAEDKVDEAIASYLKSLDIDPDVAEAHVNLGVAFLKKGKFNEGIMHFKNASRLRPDFTIARRYLAYSLAHQGKLEDAVEEYQKVLQLTPDDMVAHNGLGTVFLQQGNITEAVTHFAQAIRIESNYTGAYNNLAYILAQQSDSEKAIHLAELSCKITDFKNPFLLTLLATKYAAAGRFSEAINTDEKALDLAQSSGKNQLADEIKKHLRSYRVSQPYIEPSPKGASD